MQHILIPTDFSANAQQAAHFAIKLFGSEAHYTLVNAYEVPHSGATMLISISDILERDALQLLKSERERLLIMFPELKGRLDVKASMGTPDQVIGKLTEQEDGQLVVMGTKGASGLKSILVGSVASNTMMNVKCPVIAVPEDAVLTPPRKILFAADDKWLNEGKLPEELKLIAKRFHAEILILNVVPKGEMKYVGVNPKSEAEPIAAFDVKHSVHFIEDDEINAGIVKFMSENKVDLLAMVSRRNDLFAKLFATGNTRTMMMQTRVPLIAFH